MSMDYQLVHQARVNPFRVASDVSLNPCARLETPPVVQGLEVPQGLPVAVALLVCCFGSSLSTRGGNAKPFFDSKLIP